MLSRTPTPIRFGSCSRNHIGHIFVPLRMCSASLRVQLRGWLRRESKREFFSPPRPSDTHKLGAHSVRPLVYAGALYRLRSTASATRATCFIILTKASGVSDWAPSLAACSGSGCTSTRRPSAPQATAARHIGATR